MAKKLNTSATAVAKFHRKVNIVNLVICKMVAPVGILPGVLNPELLVKCKNRLSTTRQLLFPAVLEMGQTTIMVLQKF
jgi:hypothetical protein